MMKKTLLLLGIIAFFMACNNQKKVKTYDAAFIENAIESNSVPFVSIDDFEAKAGNFVDKEILISGIVDHICRHGGKRLFMVSDNADLHIEGEERFDEDIMGSEITVLGVVREFRVDESYCLQMEEDNIQSHKEGDSDDESFEMENERIQYFRDSMSVAKVDYLSYYSLDYAGHIEKE